MLLEKLKSWYALADSMYCSLEDFCLSHGKPSCNSPVVFVNHWFCKLKVRYVLGFCFIPCRDFILFEEVKAMLFSINIFCLDLSVLNWAFFLLTWINFNEMHFQFKRTWPKADHVLVSCTFEYLSSKVNCVWEKLKLSLQKEDR